MTRPERIDPATSMARHSRVYSSITVRHFNCRPLAHASNTESYAQTCRAAVAGGCGRRTDTRRRGSLARAPVTQRVATTAMPGQHSSDDPAVPERSEFDGNRSADIAPTGRTLPPALARHVPQASIRNTAPIGRPKSARTHAAPTGPALSRRQPAGGGRAHSPFFCVDLLHHVQLESPLRQHLLQPGIFLLKLLQTAKPFSQVSTGPKIPGQVSISKRFF